MSTFDLNMDDAAGKSIRPRNKNPNKSSRQPDDSTKQFKARKRMERDMDWDEDLEEFYELEDDGMENKLAEHLFKPKRGTDTPGQHVLRGMFNTLDDLNDYRSRK